jgi:hypothetical protein
MCREREKIHLRTDCTGWASEGPCGTTDSKFQMIVEDPQNLRHKGAGGGLTMPYLSFGQCNIIVMYLKSFSWQYWTLTNVSIT